MKCKNTLKCITNSVAGLVTVEIKDEVRILKNVT